MLYEYNHNPLIVNFHALPRHVTIRQPHVYSDHLLSVSLSYIITPKLPRNTRGGLTSLIRTDRGGTGSL